MDNRVHGAVFLSLWTKFLYDWLQCCLEILDHLVLLTYSPTGLVGLVKESAIGDLFSLE